MLAKLLATIRLPDGYWNHLFGFTGALAALKGLLDANTVQAWGGAIVAVLALVWGFWRDQRKHDRIEDHAEEMRRLNLEWQRWAVEFRKRKLEDGAADPFEGGVHPLMPYADAQEPASG